MWKILQFIKDYWYLPLFFLGVILALVLKKSGHANPVLQQVENELGAIEAQREVREVQLHLGVEQAKQHVADKYTAKRAQLDVETEKRVKSLENDPEKLAKILERLTRRDS